MVRIKRALISVSDKSGLEEFVKGLHSFGVEILSTGGTARLIQKLGIPVKAVSDFTASPEMLDGRVKTLHPKIHGGLLALRDKEEHMQQAKKFGIELIDMVVVNLYPFEETIKKPGVTTEEAIENIDIGGPSMLRSAAKNAKSVAVVSNPIWYEKILAQMKQNDGCLDEKTCFKLAAEVFERTNEYDRAIYNYLSSKLPGSTSPDAAKDEAFAQKLNLQFEKVQTLRYGENPHQQAAFYKDATCSGFGVSSSRQLHGKELSFNNILDLDAALNIVRDFKEPAASIIKHTNPCGAATATTLREAYKHALECDPLSAFGSIVGFNREVDEATAEEVISADFVECIIACGYKPAALEILKKKKNLRIMETGDFTKLKAQNCKEFDLKRVSAGVLIQDKDNKVIDKAALKIVSKKKATEEQIHSLLFAWQMVKHVKSNAIVLAQGTKLVGVGAGQMSRVDSVIIAVRKSQGRCRGAVLASDAFFPKEDAIEQAVEAGIVAIIQPGGSIRDEEVIKAADRAGIVMVFTGIRHFKH
ncbi:MAG: bifunctional phosphoribosylaminoimidazolecarboxamide formyltransferase/IMP cyclohydrolase [Candidatus Omnitrophica bacterium]|nr:bifunctional phosphoribosylaminoimidazolecarboxamide formyltransferase/IMP cyclohydrolase [Candidatus Omnitrophota bacterium]MBU1926015.1 bifunctional phosphoribosylaminoimidazolecarboxamide formyltransferase/IMP cyclohydrolase [Candidatus Omnitrophota bacterium]